MFPSPVTRRRLLLTTVAASLAGLAGCSGSPDGSADAATETTTTTPDDTPREPSDSTGTDAEADAGAGSDADADADGSTTDESPTGSPDRETPVGDTATESPTADGTETTAADEKLDLREANVTAVEIEPTNGSVRFDVTLYHDDDGEDGYANWWQVETLAGGRLGRRELLHAHGTAPFTRSATVSIPIGTTYVVVRGHDQTHGYGGQAMIVNVDTGGTEAVRQGPEPRDFSEFEPSI